MIARYDLKYELISFDFFQWLVMAAAKGATEIVFGTKEYRKTSWSAATARKRFETIIAPGPILAGLPSREDDDGESIGPVSLRLMHFVEWVRAGNKFPRLRSVLPLNNARYTITLRRQAEKPHRNSNESAWRKFASEIGARVIEDYDIKPISLHERVALYAGAEMNFGVACGPMMLATLTEYPCMVFGYETNRRFNETMGLMPNNPMPWCGDNQMTVWQSDDLPVIRKHFDQWTRSALKS